MIITGYLFVVLSVYASLQDVFIKSNSSLYAIGVFFLFIAFGVISCPLSRAFYKEYKDPKNKLIA